jgi:hypothetical protein
MSAKLEMEKGEMKYRKTFSSETTEPISTKLCRNDPWVVPFQKSVQHFSGYIFGKEPSNDYFSKI